MVSRSFVAIVLAVVISGCSQPVSRTGSYDEGLTTVKDLQSNVQQMSRISLRPTPIEEKVSGPRLEQHRKEIEGKTEEQLIELAGPMTSSLESRSFAAFAFEASVSTSANRIALYLLAMNNCREDVSSEYLGAIYEA